MLLLDEKIDVHQPAPDIILQIFTNGLLLDTNFIPELIKHGVFEHLLTFLKNRDNLSQIREILDTSHLDTEGFPAPGDIKDDYTILSIFIRLLERHIDNQQCPTNTLENGILQELKNLRSRGHRH